MSTTGAGHPPTPANEAERLKSLYALDILDTEAEERFDRITRLVQRVLGVPMASLTLVDAHRQWFKSKQGLENDEGPREHAFCAHAINDEETLYIPDATDDPRFAENPLVTGDPSIRCYAGSPIKAPDGALIGTLCAIDSTPRELTDDDLESLNDLARMAEQEIAALNLAITDGLTGLANPRGFGMLASQVLRVARRTSFPVTLLYLDVDGLKVVNDELGHDQGDRLLEDVAALLTETFRDSDVVARMGGDEFTVLLTGTDEHSADAVARLERAAAERNSEADRPYEVAFSIGRVSWPADEDGDLADLLRAADQDMLANKRARRAGR